MTQLSPHFALEEFEKDGPIDAACIPILKRLCVEVLEPVREQFAVTMTITSGNRPFLANAEAHGQPNSEHIYTPAWAAADFVLPPLVTADDGPNGPATRAVFTWMAQNPNLPYHQLILEHGQISTVIHVSINSRESGVRSVLEGSTHNASPYIKVEHVDYASAGSQPLDADQSTQV